MRARIALGAALLVVVALVATGALLYAKRRAAVGEGLRRGAAALGIAPLSLVVADASPQRIVLRDVRVGEPPDLEIARATLRFHPRELAAGRLIAVDLEGVTLRARLGEEGLTLGALDPLLEGEGSGTASPLPPVDRLSLRDGRLELATPAGPLQVFLEGHAAREARVGLVASLKLGALAESVRLDGPALRAEQLRADAEAIVLADETGLRVELEDCATLQIGALRVEDGFALEEPLAVCARGVGGPVLALDWGATAPHQVRLVVEPIQLALRTLADPPMRLAGTTPELSLQLRRAPDAEPQLELTSSGGRLDLVEESLRVSGLEARLALAGTQLAGPASLRVAAITDTAPTPRFGALQLDVRLSPRDDGYAVTASAVAAGAARMRYDGLAQLSPPATQGHFRLEPVTFSPKGLQPRELAPQLGRQLKSVAGTIAAQGRLDYEAERAKPLDFRARVEIDGLSGQSAGGALLSGLSGSVELVGPLPLRTPAGQVLTFDLVDGGAPFTDGTVRFRLSRGTVLDIEAAEWGYAGGTLRTAGRFDYAAPVQALVVEVEDLDIAELIALLDLEALEGSGRLSGRLPLEQHPDRVQVRGATLAASAPGVLRYAGAGEIPGTAGQLAALEDFQYDSLELTMDGSLDGAAVVSIRLEGRNPAYQKGRRVVLNVNVEADLGDLLRGASSATLVPEMLERRLRDRVDPGRE